MMYSQNCRFGTSRALCQPLEARRLLAVMLDPAFGDGGMTEMPLPYPGSEDSHLRGVLPMAFDRLGDGYFLSALHDYHGETDWPPSTDRFLLDAEGNPTGFGGDGYNSLPLEQFPGASTESWVRLYFDSFRLADGSLLVDNARSPEHPERFIARLLPDGSEDPDFGVDAAYPNLPSGFAVAGEGDDLVGIIFGAELADSGEGNVVPFYFQRFDLEDGSLIGEPIDVYGGRFSNEAQDAPSRFNFRQNRSFLVTAGEDGAFYLTVASDPNGDLPEGSLVIRYLLDETGFRVDPDFGDFHLPDQTEPAALIPNTMFGEDEQISVRNTGRVLGLTPEGRIWFSLGENEPEHAASDREFVVTLLKTDGSIDRSIGDNGFIHLQTDRSSGWEADPMSAFLAHPYRPIDEKNFTVTDDGSLVGIVPLVEAGSEGTGERFTEDGLALSVIRLTPEGEWDESLSGGDLGPGRALVFLPIAAQRATWWTGRQDSFMIELDGDALVMGGIVENDDDGSFDAVFSRVLLDAPTADIETQGDGRRVLQIGGTPNADDLSLALENGQIVLRSNASVVNSFDPADIDGIEITGGDGDDTLQNTLGGDLAGLVTLRGGAGNDTVTGAGRYDHVYGEAGDDLLQAGNDDTLLYGGEGSDTLLGNLGRDAIYGGPGDDVLTGGPGDDLLDGGVGDDTLQGSDGDDTLIASEGSDGLAGGDGTDLLAWYGTSRSGTADLTAGTFAYADAAGASDVSGVEDLLGGDGDDVLTGNDERNFILGGAGDDSLHGAGGKDTLIGGEGADTLSGGDDHDLLIDLEPGTTPNHFRGGGGFDRALIAADDETEFVEQVFQELNDLLAAL